MGTTRTCFVFLPIVLSAISVIFGVLTLVGGVQKAGIRDIYFLRLNTTDIYANSTSEFGEIVNAVAKDLGLKDYYQTSLWNYCSGDAKNGTVSEFLPPTYCSPTLTSYWFDPVAIIEDLVPENITTYTVPADLVDDIHVIKIAQTWLKAILIVGTFFSFFTIFACSFAFQSRLGSFLASIVAFVGALFTTVAAVLAQILGIVVRNVINGFTDVNIVATLGRKFYVLIWIAAVTSLLYWITILFTACCCVPDRSSGKKYERAMKDDTVDTEK